MGPNGKGVFNESIPNFRFMGIGINGKGFKMFHEYVRNYRGN